MTSALRPVVEWPGRRQRTGVRAWLRGLWTLPTNLFGHLAGFALGRYVGQVRAVSARAWLFELRRVPDAWRYRAVTLGNVVLFRPGTFDTLEGRVVLAHELAHTRQHDVLGPLYLPLHAMAQATSAGLCLVRPIEGASPPHAYNPLEQTWIAVGADAATPEAVRAHVPDLHGWLERFGAHRFPPED